MRFGRIRALLSRMAPAARPWLWGVLLSSVGLNLWFVWETPIVPFKPVCVEKKLAGETRLVRLDGVMDAWFKLALHEVLETHDLRYDDLDGNRVLIRLKDRFAHRRMRHITTHAIHHVVKERDIADRSDLTSGRIKLPGFNQYGRPDCDAVRELAFIGGKWEYSGPNPTPGAPDPATQSRGD